MQLMNFKKTIITYFEINKFKEAGTEYFLSFIALVVLCVQVKYL